MKSIIDEMKNYKDLRIVFMGTPEFAVTILTKLVNEGCNIVGVVTAPDRPAGRGQQLTESDVKKYARDQGLHILQPLKLKDEEFVIALKELNADLFVVVAFRMLPEVVWSMPPKGTINLHASLLPQYRGAAPINWAVINGERQTGVTTFFIEKDIDTGQVIEKEAIAIGENDNVGEVHDKLMHLGAEVTFRTVLKIAEEKVRGVNQSQLQEEELKHAPKIFKADCEIVWNQPSARVHNFIRGLSPYPTAWCSIRFKSKNELKTFKLFKSALTTIKVEDRHKLLVYDTGILFPCNDYYLSITELQPEGKRRMNYKEFLAGNSIDDLELP